jgi:hypothetical protein
VLRPDLDALERERLQSAGERAAGAEAHVVAERVEVLLPAQQRDQRPAGEVVRRRGGQQAAAGLEHAADLGQQTGGVGHVLQHLGAPHEVDARVLQREAAAQIEHALASAGLAQQQRAARGPSDYLEAARAARGQP